MYRNKTTNNTVQRNYLYTIIIVIYNSKKNIQYIYLFILVYHSIPFNDIICLCIKKKIFIK